MDKITTAAIGDEVSICAYAWWRNGRVERVKRGGLSVVVAYRLRSGVIRRASVKLDDPSIQHAGYDYTLDPERPAYLERPSCPTPAPTLAECC